MIDEQHEQPLPNNPEPDTDAEIKDYIDKNKKPLTVGLTRVLKSSKIILVGDQHTNSRDRLRSGLVEALPILKGQGLTVVAVELESDLQAQVDMLDAQDPELQKKITALSPVGWQTGNAEFLAQAKRLGLKVVCIDLNDRRADSQRDNATWQNQRDQHMFETLESSLSEVDKTLVFVGGDHIHKKPVKKYADGSVTPLGSRLVQKHGDSIKSARVVSRDSFEHFDDLLEFMSKTPRVSAVVDPDAPISIIPDNGPIKGDPRVTATDLVIIA